MAETVTRMEKVAMRRDCEVQLESLRLSGCIRGYHRKRKNEGEKEAQTEGKDNGTYVDFHHVMSLILTARDDVFVRFALNWLDPLGCTGFVERMRMRIILEYGKNGILDSFILISPPEPPLPRSDLAPRLVFRAYFDQAP